MSSNEVRQRAGKGPAKSPSKSSRGASKPTTQNAGFGILDIIRVLGGIALLSTSLSYFVTSGESLIWKQKVPWFLNLAQLKAYYKGPMRLTLAELAQYDGTDPEKPIYIAMNRTIYDVSSSSKVYGKGGSYNLLTGKDASRAYITGCMDTDLIPDMRGAEEMYVPLWLSRDPDPDELENLQQPQPGSEMENLSGGEGAKGLLKMMRDKIGADVVSKMQEEEYVRANEEVGRVLKNWEKMFDGSRGKKYYAVGRVVGEDGRELSFDGPRPKLCKLVREKRPNMKDSLGSMLGKMGEKKKAQAEAKGS